MFPVVCTVGKQTESLKAFRIRVSSTQRRTRGGQDGTAAVAVASLSYAPASLRCPSDLSLLLLLLLLLLHRCFALLHHCAAAPTFLSCFLLMMHLGCALLHPFADPPTFRCC